MKSKFKKELRPDIDEMERDMLQRTKRTVRDGDEFKRIKKPGVLNFKKSDIEVIEYKMKSGKDTNLIDIVPWEVSCSWYETMRTHSGRETGAIVGSLDYKLEYPIHTLRDGSKVLCLRTAFGKKCCVCDEWFDMRKRLQDKERGVTKDSVNKLFPKWRCAYNLRDLKEPEKGVQLLDHSFMLFETYLKEAVETNEKGIVPFCSLKRGSSLSFRGIEKSIGKSTFVDCPIIEIVDREEQYKESIIDETYQLDKMLIIPKETEVEEMFYNSMENKSDEEGEEKPKRRRGDENETSYCAEEGNEEGRPKRKHEEDYD